jgi:hypothetical protein
MRLISDGASMCRQRQLDEDAVDFRIGIEPVVHSVSSDSWRSPAGRSHANESRHACGAALISHVDGGPPDHCLRTNGEARHGCPLFAPDAQTQFIDKFVGNALCRRGILALMPPATGEKGRIIAIAAAWLKLPESLMVVKVRQRGGSRNEVNMSDRLPNWKRLRSGAC